VRTREHLSQELTRLGFTVTPSQANFVWCRRESPAAKSIYEELKRRKILVRYMNYDGYGDGLRISVGTEPEIERLLQELGQIV
jgi:histidinol-phosphate aminotransferase